MKTELKEPILKKRNSLSKSEIIGKSSKIKSNLFSSEIFKKSRTIMFFVSFNSEVHTHEMIKDSIGKKTVAIPKVIEHRIEPSMIIDFDSLIPSGRFGILEPIELAKITYKSIDMVLVPGVIFDKNGYRLGYGLGYYDRFLNKLPKAVKVGLCFDFQVMDKVPREEHDIPVDYIVTDKEIIECRR